MTQNEHARPPQAASVAAWPGDTTGRRQPRVVRHGAAPIDIPRNAACAGCDASDALRAQFAAEVHDGVLQALSGIALRLHAVAEHVDTKPGLARRQIDEIVELVRSEQATLRAFVEGERRGPATPVAQGAVVVPITDLAKRLADIARHAEWQFGLRVGLAVPAMLEVPAPLAQATVRIVQEALANVGKHARAHHADVRVAVARGVVSLAIRDDGQGFPFHGSQALEELLRHGKGPRSILQRVASLHGHLALSSSPSGSELAIRLPLARHGG